MIAFHFWSVKDFPATYNFFFFFLNLMQSKPLHFKSCFNLFKLIKYMSCPQNTDLCSKYIILYMTIGITVEKKKI